jgi:hypothetical protein
VRGADSRRLISPKLTQSTLKHQSYWVCVNMQKTSLKDATLTAGVCDEAQRLASNDQQNDSPRRPFGWGGEGRDKWQKSDNDHWHYDGRLIKSYQYLIFFFVC